MDNNIKADGSEAAYGKEKGMEDRDRSLMTLEERMGMAADSRAASPEAAASLVQRLSETQSVDWMFWRTSSGIISLAGSSSWRR